MSLCTFGLKANSYVLSADEPRRSGRATKGQHTKNHDLPEMAPTKRKGKSQGKSQKQTSNEPGPAPNGEEDEIIRCICGEYEEEEDVERDMICCDKCSAWQHNDCMGLTFPKGQEPAEYFCEQCKPESHMVLLEKMARGEKPWEEAAKLRALAAEEKKARKKKGGKRGRKYARSSDIKSEVYEDAAKSASATPAKETPIPAPPNSNQASPPAPPPPPPPSQAPPSAQKRKFDEQEISQRDPGPKQKLQRLSTGGPIAASEESSPTVHLKSSASSAHFAQEQKAGGSPAEGVGSPSELQSVPRRNVANALVKLFVEQAASAQQQGTFTMPPGQTKETVGESLGLAIEHAMYKHLSGGTGEPSEAYKQQMRTILFNVRKNTSLRDSLLVGSISPDALSTMSTHDMASKELRQKDDEIKREAERQHIIVQEQGPRIRRTHKGEELIEDDTQLGATESIFSAAPARRDTYDGEPHSATSSIGARPASPGVVHQPEFREYRGSIDRPVGHQRPHTIDSSTSEQRRASSATFNIQNVWSNIQSPGSTHHDKSFAHGTPLQRGVPPTHKVQPDAEIDQLLKDEDVESPPYSPKDFHGDGAIWRGKVSMNPVADFSATAKHVAGADLSGKIPWEKLIPPTLVIDGRIETQLATNYLCGLRFSQTTDVSVTAISPPVASHDNVEFQKIFDYFLQRKRFGVIGKHPFPAVKDTYIVPIEAGHSKKPEFIELLENNTLEDPTPERTLLVVFVVKTNNHSSPRATEPAYTTASPLTATPKGPLQQSQFITTQITSNNMPTVIANAAAASGPCISKMDGVSEQKSQPHEYSPSAPAPAPVSASASASQPSPPPLAPENLTGKAAAAQALGPLATSPAVEQLLQQAPNSDMAQLNLIAGILHQNPAAANDYQLLVTKIVENTNGKAQ
ncbi:hypothetical protein GX48_08202 [Paracoccidioides brasiliensis]|nr:hypothetical protein GX48_08202 [Paracoccidioides brasiliensis]